MNQKALGQFLMQPSTADVLDTPVRRGGILPVTEYPNRSEFDLTSGLTGALWNALTAPARAARGEISEAEQIPEAFNFAGSLTLGSLLAPRPTGSVGMGGRAAKEALDMSEAARMARAKEMGFDTDRVWYHGSASGDIDAFDLSKAGQNQTGRLARENGVFFSEDPDVASFYANYAHPEATKDSALGAVYPVYTKSKNPLLKDYSEFDEPVEYSSILVKDAIDEAKAGGHDSVILRGLMEDLDGAESFADQLIVLDPARIRSINAAFDPEKAHLANLLAANAKTGAAVPLATRALEAQQPQGIRAFHGSPHDFDRFSMDAIGTGEGAQAYGHGLYFAEAEGTAQNYKTALAGKGLDPKDVAARHNLPESVSADLYAAIHHGKDDPLEAAKAVQMKNAALRDDGPITNIGQKRRQIAQAIEDGRKLAKGHMYEVNIKADPQDFLDWDKPLSQQSEKVRMALSGIEYQPPGRGMRIRDYAETIGAAPNSEATKHLLDDKQINVTGSDIMNMLGTYTGHGKPSSSAALREAGIPGIRYLDQMSRGEGKGSSNYVVFDDNLIEILRKYGLLGPVAGGGTLAGMLMGGQEGETY